MGELQSPAHLFSEVKTLLKVNTVVEAVIEKASSEFEEGVHRVIDNGLSHGVDEAQLRRAARLLQSYELMFWDGVYRASTVDQKYWEGL